MDFSMTFKRPGSTCFMASSISSRVTRMLSTRLKPKPNEVYDVFEVDVDTEGE